MNGKRARAENTGASAGGAGACQGIEQLLLTTSELQARVGQKYCDEANLVPLLLAHGLLRRIRTIKVDVRPLGGDSFKVTLDAARPTVGEAMLEIARVQGTATSHQDLYRIAVRTDGLAVREDDADPELLEDDSMLLADGDMVAMAVKEEPLLWRTFADHIVTLTEGGALATQSAEAVWSLTTSGSEVLAGKHYWEMELLSDKVACIAVGVSRANLNPLGFYLDSNCSDGWFNYINTGALCGNGKTDSDAAGAELSQCINCPRPMHY
jgi:hypothetical protein